MYNPLGSVVKAIQNPEAVEESRKDVFRDNFDGITVDTVKAFDTGVWETGIEKPGLGWVIVEQYESRDDAEAGHARWVNDMKKDPKAELSDVLWSG